jgi:histidinol-phosphatase (PHP family)
MLADYHVHTPYCGHAKGKIIQYIENAIQFGFQEIGFADHLGRYYLSQTQKKRYWDWGMNEKDIFRYISELSDLKEIYADQITIKTGLEIDYIEGAEELLLRILDQISIDFSICSIHCLPRFSWEHLSEYNGKDTRSVYKEYFHQARSAVKSGLFSSLGHLDYIWRYIAFPEEKHDELVDEINNTINAALQSHTCLEVNANGYLWSRANKDSRYNLFEIFLELISKNHAPITIGSDAHDPSMVGKSFPNLIKLLYKKNISSMYCFSEGKAQLQQLG